MAFSDVLALRLEWLGQGPFWCEKIQRQLIRHCRQATPDWKQSELPCSTFLEHYITHAPSPYENRDFDWHLSRLKESDTSLAFGFTSGAMLHEQFGLAKELYRRQFDALLARPECSVKALLVKVLAKSDYEVLYRRAEAELLDELDTVHSLLEL